MAILERPKPPRTARISRWLGLAALALAVIGPTLARYDLIGKLAGFSVMLVGGALALVAILLGLVALSIVWAGRTDGARTALAGLVPALLVFGFLAMSAAGGAGYPALHDASTDLADPPEFGVLELRKDNLAGVETVENWRAIHAAAYPDLATIVIDKPAAAVIADAERLARARGWKVAGVDPAAGRLEATAYAWWIRFEDDVVLRVRPLEGGARSEVDMRSVSRVGVGDLGYNANRMRDFLADLKTQ
ncbi:MAG: DUF1499 domain-containing protein [Alphaproteobacteria bacterium]|nr:DUF1499 domain-containing protein [Alphaproteobacteria bacterium]